MNILFSRIKKLFPLITIGVAVFLTACSQAAPELALSDYSIIFDYIDENTLPEARLSIFMSSESDVRRYERIKITNIDTGYIWDTQKFSILEEDNTQWAGCTNLVVPDNEKIPVGRYEITYYNADEKECTVFLEIQYDMDFYDILLSSLPKVIEEKKGYEKIAIYDKDKILIFFGNRTDDLRTTRGIWNNYRNAETYRILWSTCNGRVICIEPEREVKPEVQDND